ncbi:class I SAM-dependent methyltransferase [Selenomonas noxia]|jgi:group 2 glycosyl transferase|uniref:class I SAM-dependent methyltransferase n=1 Tax=Selenomonas noxia TaxID=135083 RepID=UPI0028E245E4|nr:class I SAM-dependent methyltransferase [Selenomonas noxia]
MAIINRKFYHGEKGLEYKDSIEERMLHILKDHADDLEEYLSTGEERFIIGDMSRLRENLLSWYPFKKNASCLEIGAGVGALTGFLASRMDSVTSIEMTESRANVIAARNEARDNVEIVLANLDDVEFDKSFDYVVVVGVMEYARRFIQAENASIRFMEKAKSFLKKDGVILLAIENRLGLRYFAGAGEEHTKRQFLGLDSYDTYDYVRTFSRSELEDILSRTGFSGWRFFYPFPDYGMPSEIHSDASLELLPYAHKYYNPTLQRYRFFDETRLFRTLQNEGIAANFAHHFLVEIFHGAPSEHHILYAHAPLENGKNEFLITTLLEKNDALYLEKREVYKNGKVRRLFEAYQKLIEKENYSLQYNPLVLEKDAQGNEVLIQPYQEGKTLGEELLEAMDRVLECNDDHLSARISVLLAIFADLAHVWRAHQTSCGNYGGEEFVSLFGTSETPHLPCVKGSALALTAENFRRSGDGSYIVVGYEHIALCAVPVDFLLYDFITSWYKEVIEGYRNAEKHIALDTILKAVDIRMEHTTLYHAWQNHLYAGMNSNRVMEHMACPVYEPAFLHVDDVKEYATSSTSTLLL